MTPDVFSAIRSSTYWVMVGGTLLLVLTVVVIHYEGLLRLSRGMPRMRLPDRTRILVLILAILALHCAEIWAFGVSIYFAAQYPAMGSVGGVDDFRLLDAVYLSASTFTTVGYGDLVPHGPLRLILGSEALTGFVLITWSASFTYLEMQRFWAGDRRKRGE